MNTQQRLSILAEWLRAHKERPCPCIRQVPSSACNECSTILHGYSHGAWCERCKGTNIITDPKLQSAWVLVNDILERWPVSYLVWPVDAMRGLLEQVMEVICGIENFRWKGSLEMLFDAIMEELQAREAHDATVLQVADTRTMEKKMPDPVYILGLDPGLSGGLAVVGVAGWAECVKMPPTEKDVFDCIWDMMGRFEIRKAYIEKVHAFPDQGVTSTFTFGMNYGMLRGFLIALELPFEAVSPGVWQRALGCLAKGNKNITKAKAQELYPTLGRQITHMTADALLVATYGLRKDGRGNPPV